MMDEQNLCPKKLSAFDYEQTKHSLIQEGDYDDDICKYIFIKYIFYLWKMDPF
jgi:hypothetical protein